MDLSSLERALMAGANPVLAFKGGEFSISMPSQSDLYGRGATLAQAINIFVLRVEAFMAEIEAMPRD
jgi:hypothetical protein